jgi:hypothetical protein
MIKFRGEYSSKLVVESDELMVEMPELSPVNNEKIEVMDSLIPEPMPSRVLYNEQEIPAESISQMNGAVDVSTAGNLRFFFYSVY